ncbi:MAG: type I restriction-modification system subunit M [Arcanobacterium sp.]|nr:type I restriction-modification system subunit M [Arcanobacterium sp.]
MNKQQLAAKIWQSANKMRSKIEANEYKDYILGFIFYKFLSDRELKFMASQGATTAELPAFLTEADSSVVRHVQSNLGYFIAYENLFSTWIAAGADFEIANVRDGLSAFARLIAPKYKKVFAGIFDTLQTGLSKLGDSAASQTKAVRDLIYLIKDIPMDGKADYDVLGFIYEYLISNFAANAGKKAGEFYTPHEVSLLMSHIIADHLHDRKEIQIYDPTSGSGSLLLNIGRAVARHMDDADKIKYFAQELKANTYNLTRMNLIMRGIKPDNIVTRNADTLEDDWPYFEDDDPANTYDPLYVDAVVSNPPYSQQWDPKGKESDPRYARFGLAPKSKADYAFLLHDLYHLKPDGIMTIILPHGVLFRGGEEGQIRKNLIENNHIDAIIGLPANIFFGTGIPTIIMVLRQRRPHTDVLIVDASKGFAKEGKNNVLRASDIRRIADTVASRRSVAKFSRLVSRDEIRANDYNLNIPRYVDSSEPPETWDVYASMFGGIPAREIDALSEFWQALPGLREALFELGDSGYAHPVQEDLKEIIENSPAVAAFKEGFSRALAGLQDTLCEVLVQQRASVALSKTEDALTADIFARLSEVPLVDPYSAYQVVHDHWEKVAIDLEMIQSEGESAIRRVDPLIVVKKKNGKDAEVQDGWVGHILPFELVQEQFLSESAREVRELADAGATVTAQIQELLEGLSESDKDDLKEELNDNSDAFVTVAVTRRAKEILKSTRRDELAEGSAEFAAVRAKELLDEKKQLDKELKSANLKLAEDTKVAIENLPEQMVEPLLVAKWVTPLIEQLNALPVTLISELEARVAALAKKYATTFASLEAEIAATQRELAQMLEGLTGSDTDMKAVNELRELLGGSNE